MSHYKSNLRDIKFNLEEVFQSTKYYGEAPFGEIDKDTAWQILEEVEKLSSGAVAESFEETDRRPPVFNPQAGTVTVGEPFKKSYRALMESGWWHMDIPEHLGGAGAPPSLRWAAWEMLLGANPAAFMYMSGPGFANILDGLGTKEQKRWAELMVEHQWGATMILTEPGAGSDVGNGIVKARENEDGSWSITGVKHFITSGEHDLSENIIHLVLARPEGARSGTKGLSLFIVPKYHVDLETGELGERNGVFATKLESKMGLKASATCEMTFGANAPAIGWLIGDTHDGIAQMFRVIEYARMLVGTKAIATLSTGYLTALEYAKERIQGADMTNPGPDAPRVAITNHPDVRASLMTQKTYAEGLRALVALTAWWQDQEALAGEDEAARSRAEAMNDLLLPIVKGVGSERSYEMLSASLQTLGGAGYLQDYPIEQYIRDAKIDTLYEGTTAIQGLDFFFRKMIKNQFQAAGALFKAIEETCQGAGEQEKETARLVLEALGRVKEMVETMTGWAAASLENKEEAYKVGLNTTRLLLAAGDLIIGWLLLRQAIVARGKLEETDDEFYKGKVLGAHWFASQRLPLLAGQFAALRATDLEVMNAGIGEF